MPVHVRYDFLKPKIPGIYMHLCLFYRECNFLQNGNIKFVTYTCALAFCYALKMAWHFRNALCTFYTAIVETVSSLAVSKW